MTKRAAKEEVLGELHAKVAEVMTNALNRADTAAEGATEDGIAIEVNPALLGAVTKFLKDNEITCDTGAVEELSSTERRLRDKRNRRMGADGVLALQDLPVTEDE